MQHSLKPSEKSKLPEILHGKVPKEYNLAALIVEEWGNIHQTEIQNVLEKLPNKLQEIIKPTEGYTL